MWALLCLGLAMGAGGAEVVVLGDDTDSVNADETYKLNQIDVTSDVALVQFSVWLDSDAGAEVNFVVYEQSGGYLWDLVWQSENTAVDAGQGFKQSPPFEVPLVAGSSYAIGLYLTNDNVTYFFAPDAGGMELPFGTAVGTLFADGNGAPEGDVINPLQPESQGAGLYYQQLAYVSAIDEDGDGYGVGADCNDGDATINPGAEEVCDDGIDNDCDGDLDGADSDTRSEDYWPDADADGYGDEASEPLSTCEEAPEGMVGNSRDCDDAAADVSPDGVETCDGRDEDCNGDIDEGFERVKTWPDTDGDGFGNGDAQPELTCAEGAPGFSDNDTDCDDAVAVVYPGAPELCDGLDNDCDFIVPANETEDGDSDGALTCADCNDADDSSYPGAAEEDCDGIDHDCDGSVVAIADCLAAADEVLLVGSCEGCATGTPEAGWLGIVALAAALRRRRDVSSR